MNMMRSHHGEDGSNTHNAFIGGKWTFDERNLEWLFETKSGTIIADKHQDSKKKKRPAGLDAKLKKTDRISSSLARTAGGPSHHGAGAGSNRHQSPAPRVDKNKQTVELEDVKNAGLEALYGGSKYVSKEFLKGIFDAEIFDDFLMYLLQYFDCFFKKQAAEEKKAKSTSIEPGRRELLAHANSIECLKIAEKQLGKCYCHLVMGIGVEDAHHMACGLSRSSATTADRRMFENFYMFCCFFIWIAFKRQKLQDIQLETGRLLRSDTFNPATKKPAEPAVKEDYSKFHKNRPAVSSIMYQRSPAMVAIFPSPKQDAQHLFTNKPLPSSGIKNLRTIEQQMAQSEEQVLLKTLRVGILGESMSGYYKKNLAPIEPDIEEGKENEKNGNQANATMATGLPGQPEGEAEGQPEPEPEMVRADTVLSHATTSVPDA